MRSSLIVIFIAGCLISAHAQETSIGATVQLSFPQGDYQSNFPKTGVGMRINIMHRLNEDGPLSLGGELGYLVAGSRARYFSGYYGGYFDTYKLSASSNVFALAFKARADLSPAERPIRFFIEATVGANLFFSSVSLQGQSNFGGSQYVDGDNSKGYWSFSWGPGVGVEIPIDKKGRVGAIVKGAYLLGTNTTYLTDPSIDNSGNVYFTQHESKTNMIIAEFGVRFSLSKKR
jgi:hypothetical protein